MRKRERVETLQGLFWPRFWAKIEEMMSKSDIISETTKSVGFKDINHIHFVFKRGDKMKIYREFIHAFENEWVRVEPYVVVRYLAEYTNMTNCDDMQTRINTIRQGFKRYRKHYTK